MSTTHHTPIVPYAAADAATFNAPLSQLDTTVSSLMTSIGSGAGWATTLDGSAAAAQAVVPVTSTTGAVVGMPIYIGLTSGTHEVGVIASISDGVSVTLTANLANTYASGTPISATPAEVADARGTYANLGSAVRHSGSAFPGSPATGDLFTRTDRSGAVYVWTGTAWSQIGVPSVTAFWGTPDQKDRAYRSDLGKTAYYSGSAWYNVAESIVQISGPVTSTTSTIYIAVPPNVSSTLAVLYTRVDLLTRVDTTNDVSNYWDVVIAAYAGATWLAALGTFDTSADALASWIEHSAALAATVAATSTILRLLATKTGAPGTLYVAARLYGREILV